MTVYLMRHGNYLALKQDGILKLKHPHNIVYMLENSSVTELQS